MTALFGIPAFIAFAWLVSLNRRAFPWRTVLSGLGLQVALAFLILRTDFGQKGFAGVDHVVRQLLAFASEGSVLVFGPLGSAKMLEEAWGPGNGFLLAITISSTIIFVSAVSAALYHYGILQRLVQLAAWVMGKLMGTSGSESLAAAANVFMGQTEAPLLVQPYLATMTRSEMMSLMVGGMATIAGGVFATYVLFGISAGHLLAASVMSAPAALMMAKILLPETEISVTRQRTMLSLERNTTNGVDALCQGASDGIKLAINVIAMLIAFVATVALINAMLAGMLSWFDIQQPKPLQWILGWMQFPFAWLMGVPAAEAREAGAILGERIVLNEFVGYLSLSQQRETLTPHTTLVLTYALCGFANFASIAIQIGGISVLVPERRHELASLGLRAMVGGILACYCTACVASLLTPAP